MKTVNYLYGVVHTKRWKRRGEEGGGDRGVEGKVLIRGQNISHRVTSPVGAVDLQISCRSGSGTGRGGGSLRRLFVVDVIVS